MAKVLDLKNQKFGKLTVIGRESNNRYGQSMWLCQCECGNSVIVNGRDLRNGHTKSCGCLHNKQSRNFKDITGMKFNRLTALSLQPYKKDGRCVWKCLCDCGNIVDVTGKELRANAVKSCGCLRRDNPNHKTHGMTDTPIYRKWSMIKTRCNNPKRDHYQWYGGKGIKVCKEWQVFENFYAWALANGYSDELTIERIDIAKDYEPSNCKWIPLKEQAYNKSNTRWLTFNGQKKSLKEWSDELGWKPWVLSTRLNKYHWSVEKALTTPLDTTKWKSKRKQ